MEREIKNKRLLKLLIAILWLILFLSFFISRLPYSSIGGWIERRIEEKTNIGISIKGLRLTKGLGFFVDFLEIKKDFGDELLKVGFREVYINPDIKMLIRGVPAFELQGRIAEGGSVDGRYEGGEEQVINLSWEGVEIKKIKHPWQKRLPPLSNPTNGEASLVIIKKGRGKGSKTIEIKLQGAGIPSAGFKLPAIKLATGDIISGKIKVVILP
ncbi:MAG: hypothetical protein ACE5IH_06015 [Thermodesulfobacteriota bacterium]